MLCGTLTQVTETNTVVLNVTSFKIVLYKFYFILLVNLFILAVPCDLRDLSSLTRDRTRALTMKAPSTNLDCQGIPYANFILFFKLKIFYLFIYFWLRHAARGILVP